MTSDQTQLRKITHARKFASLLVGAKQEVRVKNIWRTGGIGGSNREQSRGYGSFHIGGASTDQTITAVSEPERWRRPALSRRNRVDMEIDRAHWPSDTAPGEEIDPFPVRPLRAPQLRRHYNPLAVEAERLQ